MDRTNSLTAARSVQSAGGNRKRNWLAWLENFLVPRHRRSMNG
ncbi:MAG: hypothetical protein AB7S80_04845 [Rhizobiaceae bacterium]